MPFSFFNFFRAAWVFWGVLVLLVDGSLFNWGRMGDVALYGRCLFVGGGCGTPGGGFFVLVWVWVSSGGCVVRCEIRDVSSARSDGRLYQMDCLEPVRGCCCGRISADVVG